MKKILSISIIIIIFSGGTLFAGNVKWYDFNAGLKLAKAKKKPIIIDFYADWCHWCKVMDKETFSDSQVSNKLRKDFIAIRLDADSRKSNISYLKYKNITSQYLMRLMGGKGLPYLIFMDYNGDIITGIPGYVKKELFLPVLGYIKSKCYLKKVPFEKYLKDKKKCK
jgi:thioredoxin-related protein